MPRGHNRRRPILGYGLDRDVRMPPGQHRLRVSYVAGFVVGRVEHHIAKLGLRDDVISLHVLTERSPVRNLLAVLPVAA